MTTIPGIQGNWRKVDTRHGYNLYESEEYGRNVPMLVVDDGGNLIKETRGSLSVALGDRHHRKSIHASPNRRSRAGWLASRNTTVDLSGLAEGIIAYREIDHYTFHDQYDDIEEAYNDLMGWLSDTEGLIALYEDFQRDIDYGEELDPVLAISIRDRLALLLHDNGVRV